MAHVFRRRSVRRRLPADPLGALLLCGQRESEQPVGGAFGDNLFLWGLWDLGIAVLALWAGYSLLGGNTFGRVIGYAWGVLVIVQSFMILEYAPWFGFASLLVAMLVIFALSATSEWKQSPSAMA